MMSSSVKNFTTTLPVATLSVMTSLASDLHMSKNEIIVAAVDLWSKQHSQEKIRSQYQSAASDAEWLSLADMGGDITE